MRADNLESYEVLLIINQDTRVLYPLSAHAFHFAQGTLASVAGRSGNELVLDREGSVCRIAGVWPLDDGVAARLKRLVGVAYAIEVELEPLSVELEALKNLVLGGLRDYVSRLDGDESWAFVLQPFPEIEAAVREAEDTRTLYETLSLPGAMDCLDLL